MVRKLLYSTLLCTAASIVAAACSNPDGSTATAPCTGKCDGTGSDSTTPPDEAAVSRLIADAKRDGTIDEREAALLAAFLKAATRRNDRIAARLDALVRTEPTLTAAAADLLRRALRGERNDVPLDNAVYRVVTGSSTLLDDDVLYIVGDGAVKAWLNTYCAAESGCAWTSGTTSTTRVVGTTPRSGISRS